MKMGLVTGGRGQEEKRVGLAKLKESKGWLLVLSKKEEVEGDL